MLIIMIRCIQREIKIRGRYGDKMAKTVNVAFNEFLCNTVNLDSQNTQTARSSRDNLISNINNFSSADDFLIYIQKKV